MLMVFDRNLSIPAMHRICKKAGAERVIEPAANEMTRVLEEVGLNFSFSLHSIVSSDFDEKNHVLNINLSFLPRVTSVLQSSF